MSPIADCYKISTSPAKPRSATFQQERTCEQNSTGQSHDWYELNKNTKRALGNNVVP